MKQDKFMTKTQKIAERQKEIITTLDKRQVKKSQKILGRIDKQYAPEDIGVIHYTQNKFYEKFDLEQT